MTEIFNCDECGDQFVKFTIDPDDDWAFDHIIQFDGRICKACIYLMLYKHYRKKVWDMKDLVGNW